MLEKQELSKSKHSWQKEIIKVKGIIKIIETNKKCKNQQIYNLVLWLLKEQNWKALDPTEQKKEVIHILINMEKLTEDVIGLNIKYVNIKILFYIIQMDQNY